MNEIKGREGLWDKKIFFRKKGKNRGTLNNLSWNIAGIGKAVGLREYLDKFWIIALQETWLERKSEKEFIEKLNRGYV